MICSAANKILLCQGESVKHVCHTSLCVLKFVWARDAECSDLIREIRVKHIIKKNQFYITIKEQIVISNIGNSPSIHL